MYAHLNQAIAAERVADALRRSDARRSYPGGRWDGTDGTVEAARRTPRVRWLGRVGPRLSRHVVGA